MSITHFASGATVRRTRCVGPILLTVVLGLIASACRSAGDSVTTDPAVAAAAEAVLAEARVAEPAQTARVEALAREHGGRAAGLEHRLKTLESTEDKIGRLLLEEPGTAAGDLTIYDALRYTIVLEDDPPGSHVRAVRAILYSLEEDGNTVQSVKNYWLRGDSYSGVNTVLLMPGGLCWELQFHTPASWETKESTHESYERMRAPETPVAEKRRIFEDSAVLWDAIPIPAHMLDGPGTLHPAEEIRFLPDPEAAAAALGARHQRAAG